MSLTEVVRETHKRADVDGKIVMRTALLILGGWIGGFAWDLARADAPMVEKFKYTIAIFVIGLVFMAAIHYAFELGPATVDVYRDGEGNPTSDEE